MAVLLALALTRQAGKRVGLLAVPLLAALATGCVTVNEVQQWTTGKPAVVNPCQIVGVWENNVQFVPDSTHGGAPMPGLKGRMYLFDQNLHPLQVEGALIVDLYEETDAQPVMLERWQIDPQTLSHVYCKDFIGGGYTLFLPLSKYRAEMSKVRLRTGFKPATAQAALFTENAVTLADVNGVIHGTSSQSTVPPQPPGPPAGPLGMNPSLPIGPGQGMSVLPRPNLAK